MILSANRLVDQTQACLPACNPLALFSHCFFLKYLKAVHWRKWFYQQLKQEFYKSTQMNPFQLLSLWIVHSQKTQDSEPLSHYYFFLGLLQNLQLNVRCLKHTLLFYENVIHMYSSCESVLVTFARYPWDPD